MTTSVDGPSMPPLPRQAPSPHRDVGGGGGALPCAIQVGGRPHPRVKLDVLILRYGEQAAAGREASEGIKSRKRGWATPADAAAQERGSPPQQEVPVGCAAACCWLATLKTPSGAHLEHEAQACGVEGGDGGVSTHHRQPKRVWLHKHLEQGGAGALGLAAACIV
jgi:hypothetical protein